MPLPPPSWSPLSFPFHHPSAPAVTPPPPPSPSPLSPSPCFSHPPPSPCDLSLPPAPRLTSPPPCNLSWPSSLFDDMSGPFTLRSINRTVRVPYPVPTTLSCGWYTRSVWASDTRLSDAKKHFRDHHVAVEWIIFCSICGKSCGPTCHVANRHWSGGCRLPLAAPPELLSTTFDAPSLCEELPVPDESEVAGTFIVDG